MADAPDLAALKALAYASPHQALAKVDALLDTHLPDPTRLEVLRLRAALLGNLELTADALAASDEALALARSMGQPGQLISVLRIHAAVHTNFGQLETATQACQEALTACLLRGDRLETAITMDTAASLAAGLGRFDQALEVVELALLLLREVEPDARWHGPWRGLHHNRALVAVQRLVYASATESESAALPELRKAAANALAKAWPIARQDQATRTLVSLGCLEAAWTMSCDPRSTLVLPDRPADSLNEAYACFAAGVSAASMGQPGVAAVQYRRALDRASCNDLAMAVAGRLALVGAFRQMHRWPEAFQVTEEAQVLLRTRARQAEQQTLDEMLARLRRERQLSRLFISHDLRSPLQAMRTLCRHQMEGSLSPEVALQSELHTLSDRAFEYARGYVSHTVEITPTSVGVEAADLAAVVDEALATVRRVHRAREPGLSMQIEPGLLVQAPSEALLRVITNLLENAIHAAAGQPRVEVHARGTDQGVFVSVRDHGPGLPVPQLLNLVEAPVPLRSPQSFGLGLRFVVTTVHALQGHIVAHNEADGGACISLMLPAGARRP